MWQDAKEGFTSAIDSFWGGQCVSAGQCADYVATCSSQGKQAPPLYLGFTPFIPLRRMQAGVVDVDDLGLSRPLPHRLLCLLYLLRYLLLHQGLYLLLSMITVTMTL